MIVHTLTDTGIDPRHPDAIMVAVQQAVEHGDAATQADPANLRADVWGYRTAFGAGSMHHRRLGWEE